MIDPQKFGEQLSTLVKAAIAKEVRGIEVDLRNKIADLKRELEAVSKELAALKAIEPVAPTTIKEARVELGKLVIEMSDGQLFNAGEVSGPKGEKGEPGQDGKPGEPGQDGKPGADGAGIADALIDRDGKLTLTFSDGRTKSLGEIVGKDGQDGKPGADGADGAPGKDGVDGLGFEDLGFEMVDERHFKVFARRGDKTVELIHRVPTILYRGVFREGDAYEPGDAVTHGGCLWIAKADAPGRPTEGSEWQLAVKKGRDGRDFEVRDAPKGVKL